MNWTRKKSEPEELCERVRQRGFADTGEIFDEQVSARQQAGKCKPDLPLLAEDDLAGSGDGG